MYYVVTFLFLFFVQTYCEFESASFMTINWLVVEKKLRVKNNLRFLFAIFCEDDDDSADSF